VNIPLFALREGFWESLLCTNIRREEVMAKPMTTGHVVGTMRRTPSAKLSAWK
jgi:hypothetical protein